MIGGPAPAGRTALVTCVPALLGAECAPVVMTAIDVLLEAAVAAKWHGATGQRKRRRITRQIALARGFPCLLAAAARHENGDRMKRVLRAVVIRWLSRSRLQLRMTAGDGRQKIP